MFRISRISISIFISLIFCFSSVLAFEKVGTTSFQFLKVMTDARSTGMAGAYTAVTDKSDAVFWNPASLINIAKFDAQISYLDYFLDVRHSSVSAAWTFNGLGTFGVQGIITDVGEIEVTTVDALGFIGDVYNPGLTGETINPTSLVLGLSFARGITDKFAFGITGKFVREDLVVARKNLFMFDGGILYRTGFHSLELAAALKNFGSEVKYYEDGYPLPQTLKLGISGYIFSPTENIVNTSENHSLLISFDLVQPRDYDQQYSIGSEYGFKNLIFLRGGYKLNFDEESFAAGMGVLFKNYRFDYSFNDFGEYLDALHRFSFGVEIK